MTDAGEFAAATSRAAEIAAAERADPTLDPRCVSFALHRAERAPDAVVLLHGFTNCPRQMADLAGLFFERGCNVYVPRLPRHGLRDKLTTELAGLTADELIACGRQAVQIGAGLGARLCVLGLSVGATLAAWLAQNIAFDRLMAVAPFFSVVRVPSLLEPALAGALALAPNLELWWDPRVKAAARPDHAYPRFATHALAQCLDLGHRVHADARSSAAKARDCILVLNAKDPAIDNGAARAVWTAWQSHGTPTDVYTFEDLDVRHDIIEPETYPQARTLVYPVLLRLAAR